MIPQAKVVDFNQKLREAMLATVWKHNDDWDDYSSDMPDRMLVIANTLTQFTNESEVHLNTVQSDEYPYPQQFLSSLCDVCGINQDAIVDRDTLFLIRDWCIAESAKDIAESEEWEKKFA